MTAAVEPIQACTRNPDEIVKNGGAHMSRADFTHNTSIELEADHFASGPRAWPEDDALEKSWTPKFAYGR
jgi:hypothetical protein